MTRVHQILPLALVLAAGTACGRKPAPKAAEAEHAHEEAAIPVEAMRGIRLLEVAEARTGARWMPGEAQGDEAAQAVLSCPVKGIVSRLVAIPGQARRAGEVLAVVQSPELARLKAEWIAAKSRLTRARADLAREERLFQAGAGARRDLETVRAEAETAEAGEEAARLSLEAVGLPPSEAGASFPLRAPSAGSLVAWKVQRGQGVEAGQELGAFQAARASIVKVEVPQPGPVDWAPGAETEVRQAGGRTWRARLEGTPTALTADTRRLAYRLRFLGGPLPIPGTPVEVKVPLDKGIYLPQSALQQMEGRWGVFVVSGGQAAFRPVTRGADIQAEVLILDGLKPGETVVAEGAYLLKARHQKQAEPEGEGGHGH
ncbi:efflux RND transporter periplasmic adaptor subunit [Mesoterricola sediminis]|uniref:MexH family multidrug efflux RND transporter periplasmic adaptor subunit n=1 Tax=Mesoterricola sediminis TaxID=2927980 RepID=A0AA48GY34_9BACT|nr:efflux RND transporter periplasmic adaptor subunit [Mesoterricola sediminis]BDU78404.1 MexH family multidrug efflux RND transporter periplasmic adaptor subunit [Mesoterricola sediminis]